eukprot:16340960-Heterocapsa_arctica.AAC.1
MSGSFTKTSSMACPTSRPACPMVGILAMAKAVRRRPPTAVLMASSRMSDCCLPLSGCSKRTRVC